MGDFALSDALRATVQNPGSDAERAAIGQGSAPTSVTSLDDLRIMALLKGSANMSQTLAEDKDKSLVKAWLAVGKP